MVVDFPSLTIPLLLSLTLPLAQQLFAVSGRLRPYSSDEAVDSEHDDAESSDSQDSPPRGRVRQGKHDLNLPTNA
nr:hypothetical protein [Streptomyces sp. S1D4-11]QIY93731.1 hypothetical protein HEP87_05910 [Streptomyces sp. S1D4-11]